MRLARFALSFFSLITLLISVTAVFASPTPQASDLEQPLFFLKDGDIYSYTVASGQVEQLTTWGYNDIPVLSPTGTRFAYNSVASMVVEAFPDDPTIWVGSDPSNIWVWDIASGEATRIVDQPASVGAAADGFPGAITRSNPTWSPDGNQLAWLEYVFGGETLQFQLAVYDFQTDETRIISSEIPSGFQDGGLYIPSPMWGSGGIALSRIDILAWEEGDSLPAVSNTVTVYDENGNIMAEFDAVSGENSTAAILWLTDRPNTLALAYVDGHWETYDVSSGSRQTVSGSVQLYSLLAPDNPAVQLVTAGTEYGMGWQGRDWRLPTLQPQAVALAPFGNAYAYMNNGLVVSANNTETLIPDTAPNNYGSQGVVWGPTGWRIIAEAIVISPATPVPLDLCQNIAAPRLSIGGTARVLPGLGGGNALRAAPATGSGNPTMTVIPENGVMNVVNGPVCADSFWWWEVEYNGTTGWTPEGEGDTYWLEPGQG